MLERIKVDAYDIKKTADSGQCFSIQEIGSNFKVLSADKYCEFIRVGDHFYLYCEKEDVPYWMTYFGGSVPYDRWITSIQSCKYDFLRKCADYSRGLVILKQDLWEMIVSFIISQRKSIPAIKTSLNRLREKYGREVILDSGYLLSKSYKTFPTADDLKNVTVEDLSDCGMGYRAKYVVNAVKWWNSLSGSDMSSLIYGNYDIHMNTLKQISGVGDKVANCICLFAFNNLDAFPVDVWIQRIKDKGLIPDDLSEFDGYKGFLQQVIFFYVISHKDEFK